MAMRPCDKCLENDWEYEHIDGYIKATCNICGNEVEFPAKNSRSKEKILLNIGDKCPKCLKADLVLRKTKKNKKKSAYIFTHYLWCWKCNQIFHQEKYKKLNK